MLSAFSQARSSSGANPLAVASSSARNGPIVFQSAANHLYLVGVDGRSLRQLTSGSHEDGWPAWSPDGRRIAFVRDELVTVMNGDGSGVRVLFDAVVADLFADEVDGQPAWSPDGKWIAFVRSGEGMQGRAEGTIWRIRAAGGKPVAVTRGMPGSEFEPSWSPDGKWIAFTRDRTGEATTIWVVHPDGTGLRQLTAGNDTDGSPDWSPDGKRIVFVRYHPGNPPAYKPPALMVVNAGGSGLMRLTSGKSIDNSPAWSPDGKQIAFTSERNATGNFSDDVFTLTLTAGHVARVTRGTLGPVHLDWQPLQ